jgi:hypothetical protein
MTLNGVKDLIRAIGDVANTENEDPGLIPTACRIANIDPAYVGPPSTNLPSVIFEGETSVSLKTYQIINPSYVPIAGDRVIMMPVGRTYVIAGPVSINLDTGWVNTIANVLTAVSPHSVTSVAARRVGNIASAFFSITLGATITVPSDGNIANPVICQLISPFLPTASGTPSQPLASGSAGPIISGYVQSGSGQIVLAATVPGASMASGTSFTLGGMYFI